MTDNTSSEASDTTTANNVNAAASLTVNTVDLAAALLPLLGLAPKKKYERRKPKGVPPPGHMLKSTCNHIDALRSRLTHHYDQDAVVRRLLASGASSSRTSLKRSRQTLTNVDLATVRSVDLEWDGDEEDAPVLGLPAGLLRKFATLSPRRPPQSILSPRSPPRQQRGQQQHSPKERNVLRDTV